MTLEKKIRDKITEKGFSSDEGKFLRVVLGEVQLEQNRPGFKEEKSLGVIKKMIAGNNETLGYLTKDDSRFGALEAENELLQQFLPSYLSEDEIEESIKAAGVDSEIVSAGNEGQAMGLAMKHFKMAGLVVEGGTVKSVVERLRS